MVQGKNSYKNHIRRHGCLRMEDNMNINGINGTSMPAGTAGMGAGSADQMDPVSKNLRNQIDGLKRQMQELAANQEMSADAKMKKRQDIQKQISELEIQLRQHQMEVKREQTRKKKEESNALDEMTGAKKQAKQDGGRQTGLSTGSMEAMISADASLKQADVHGSTAQKMDNRAGVIETEIMLDRGRGGSSNIELKEAELADAKALADQATASQMQSLAQANETIQDAAKEEQKDEKTDGVSAGVKEEDQTAGGAAGSGLVDASDTASQAAGAQKAEEKVPGVSGNDTYDVEMPGVAFSRGYQPVDIKL